MGKYRRGRINDAVAEELAIALGNVREPKVIDNFVKDGSIEHGAKIARLLEEIKQSTPADKQDEN